MASMQKDPKEAVIATLAAPMTPSLKRFSMKPPVMMPKATAGRFSIPGRMNKWMNDTGDRVQIQGELENCDTMSWTPLKVCRTVI